MQNESDSLKLNLGYSREFTTESEFRELLELMIGKYRSVRFHVEETSGVTVCVCIEGQAPLGLPPIQERLGGRRSSRHSTKNGTFVDLEFGDGVVTLSLPEFIPSAKQASVAVNS